MLRQTSQYLMSTGITNPNKDPDTEAGMSLSEAKENGAILINQPQKSRIRLEQIRYSAADLKSIINRAQAVLRVNEAERFKA